MIQFLMTKLKLYSVTTMVGGCAITTHKQTNTTHASSAVQWRADTVACNIITSSCILMYFWHLAISTEQLGQNCPLARWLNWCVPLLQSLHWMPLK